MNYTIYQVDAFAEKLFTGNPAAVVPLNQWLPDELLQKIAAENNLAETVYYIVKDHSIEIRWFTPNTEVDLCGHATLAAAFILNKHEGFPNTIIPFYSPRSGDLPVSVKENLYTMDFPCDTIQDVPLTNELITTTSIKPVRAFKGKTDYMLVFDKHEDIETMKPNYSVIQTLEARGLIVTAKGKDCDFVSRFFAPQCGINEDPVTGSAHTTLTPYWSRVLNKKSLTATQLSSRKGKLSCVLNKDRVEITGQAVLYMKGKIEIQ